MPTLNSFILKAIHARDKLLAEDPNHERACRLFNGFYEGEPRLIIDLYGKTAVLFNYADLPQEIENLIQELVKLLPIEFPFIGSIIEKQRNASTPELKNGIFLLGKIGQTSIEEHGVRYSLDLTINQDASFYLDTCNLRKWILENMAGKSVLNTFAYTGSLGTAAQAAGASMVQQTDIDRKFLNLAKTSYTLNGFPIKKNQFISEDFFRMVSRLKHDGRKYDCVILDPPFFSTNRSGRVDQLTESPRLINKVRPLIYNGGWLVAINNALYLSGADYIQQLETLCADGYLSIEELIAIPESITGFPDTIQSPPPANPAPFNHPTKIAILKVKTKE